MGIVIKGTEELKFLLEQAGTTAMAGVLDQMRKEAKAIRDLAREMAPIDHGNLEEAIVTKDEGGGRGAGGRFQRKSIAVMINMELSVPERPGKTVGDYAWEMHEHLSPFGPLKLGEYSEAKQQGQQVMVGGKFLERAADQVSKDMMKRLVGVLRMYI